MDTHWNYYTWVHKVIFFSPWGVVECCEDRQCVVGALWCASAGFHLPVLWLPLPGLIENIPWNFLTLPWPRHHFTHTYMCACVFLWHKSHMILGILSPPPKKRVVPVKNYTCSIARFEVWSTSDLYAESWFLCTCSAVQAYNNPLCRQSGPMCFAVACGVVVLKWWLRGRVYLACMSLCPRGSSSLRLYLLFSALFFLTCLSFCCRLRSSLSFTLIPIYLT